MNHAPYSFSKISTYNQCPKKFKFHYIDKIKVPFVYSEPLIKGGCVHHILEHHPTLSTHKRQEKYQHIADKFLESDLGKEIYMYELQREIDIGLTPDLIPCSYNDQNAMFRGSVDCMFIQMNIDNNIDKMVLVDYKTGKLRDEKYMDYTQLTWYSIYFFKKYPKLNTIEISYVYVEHLNEHKSKTFSRSELPGLIKSLQDNIATIESDELYLKNDSPLCNYCDCQAHCMMVKEVPPENDFLNNL